MPAFSELCFSAFSELCSVALSNAVGCSRHLKRTSHCLCGGPPPISPGRSPFTLQVFENLLGVNAVADDRRLMTRPPAQLFRSDSFPAMLCWSRINSAAANQRFTVACSSLLTVESTNRPPGTLRRAAASASSSKPPSATSASRLVSPHAPPSSSPPHSPPQAPARKQPVVLPSTRDEHMRAQEARAGGEFDLEAELLRRGVASARAHVGLLRAVGAGLRDAGLLPPPPRVRRCRPAPPRPAPRPATRSWPPPSDVGRGPGRALGRSPRPAVMAAGQSVPLFDRGARNRRRWPITGDGRFPVGPPAVQPPGTCAGGRWSNWLSAGQAVLPLVLRGLPPVRWPTRLLTAGQTDF